MKNTIDEMTIGKLITLQSLLNNNAGQATASPFEVGKAYVIRTVTMHWHGVAKAVDDKFLVLEKAAWIGDTGRFADCLKPGGEFAEVEPAHNDVIVAVASIVDATEHFEMNHVQK